MKMKNDWNGGTFEIARLQKSRQRLQSTAKTLIEFNERSKKRKRTSLNSKMVKYSNMPIASIRKAS